MTDMTRAENDLQEVARLVTEAEAADSTTAASLYRRAADLLEYLNPKVSSNEQALQGSETLDRSGRIGW